LFALALSRDQTRIALSHIRSTVVRDVESGRELLEVPGHWWDAVFGGPNGRWLAVSGQNGTEVWNVDARAKLPHAPIPSVGAMEARGRRLSRLALADDGPFVATVGDQTVSLWDATTGVRHTSLYGHGGEIRAIAFTRDGKHLAVALDDWTVHRHPLQIPDLMALARKLVKRTLTSEECQRYLGRPQCPAPTW
jgi:WD40 repeat protein